MNACKVGRKVFLFGGFISAFILMIIIALDVFEDAEIDMTGIGNCGTPRCIDQ